LSSGKMLDLFHCDRTVAVASEWLNIVATGSANTGAPNLRHHAGTLSRPMSVECR